MTSASHSPSPNPIHKGSSAADAGANEGSATAKRPAAGERRLQILQTLAQMLERPSVERITTASIAKALDLSEAALYRHFASKAQMYEALMDFVESSIFGLVNHAQTADTANHPEAARDQTLKLVAALLQFAEQNPGLCRVMAGDALVGEDERLQTRMSACFDKLEAALKQALRTAYASSPSPTHLASVVASGVVAFYLGRVQRFARSGFTRKPTEHALETLQRLI